MLSIPNAGSIHIADLTGYAVVRVAAGATVAGVAKAIVDNQVGADETVRSGRNPDDRSFDPASAGRT